MATYKFTFVMLAFLSLSYADAQTIAESTLPAAVKKSFVKLYPGTEPKWEKEGRDFEANFKQNGQNISVLFAANGAQKETETRISASSLKQPILNYIKTHYRDQPVSHAEMIKKADGTVLYEVEIKDKDVMFDENGNFLKSEKN